MSDRQARIDALGIEGNPQLLAVLEILRRSADNLEAESLKLPAEQPLRHWAAAAGDALDHAIWAVGGMYDEH
jgi:hypothetical protein